MWIDWGAPAVYVQARVVLRAGQLEFLACWPGKEHESVIRCGASAARVYLALGLIGMQPGHPPVWDEDARAFRPPAGDLLDLAFVWRDGERVRQADAYDWLQETEYERTPLPRPWILAGSIRRTDGALASDATGAGVALVDFADSLIAYSRRFGSDDGALWAAANTDAIPGLDTEVWLVLRPARPREYKLLLDSRGVLWVNGRYCTPADALDLLALQQRLRPDVRQSIVVRGALRSDVRRWRELLRGPTVAARGLAFVGPGGSALNQTGDPGSVSGDGASADSQPAPGARFY